MLTYINLGGLLERSGAADRAVELWRVAANRSVPVNGNAVIYANTALKQIARVLSDRLQTEGAESAVQERGHVILLRRGDVAEAVEDDEDELGFGLERQFGI